MNILFIGVQMAWSVSDSEQTSALKVYLSQPVLLLAKHYGWLSNIIYYQKLVNMVFGLCRY